jgi:hypothetical protein
VAVLAVLFFNFRTATAFGGLFSSVDVHSFAGGGRLINLRKPAGRNCSLRNGFAVCPGFSYAPLETLLGPERVRNKKIAFMA